MRCKFSSIMEFFKGIFYGLAIVIFMCYKVEGQPTSTVYDAPLTVENCGKSLVSSNFPDRIVGGSYALAGQYPWMVSLRERDKHGFEHVCGATILNRNWIVTAAHCPIFQSPRRYEVLLGLHKQSEEHQSTVKRHKIERIVIHEDYDKDKTINDIALLKVSKPIDIDGSRGYINGVCLPQNKKDPSGYGTVIGWGHTIRKKTGDEDGDLSDTLKQIVLPIIPRKKCNEVYDEDPDDNLDEILDTMICAGGIKGKDSCQSDSGGPLLQTDKNGITTLIGIVSYGIGCGNRNTPGVYTKISMYEEWMAYVMNQ